MIETNSADLDSTDSSVGGNPLLARILKRLAEARDRLVDRNLRNKLINTSLKNTRSKNIRIWDELSDQVFTCLLSEKKSMTFGFVDLNGEDDPDTEAIDLVDHSEESAVDILANPDRHTDTLLETRLSRVGLERKLRALYYEAADYEEEQGVNILYLALGFLKWYEDSNSDIERFAPLVLLPVELVREGAKDRYKLSVRDEDLMTNVSLKLWLKEQHAIELPELPESEAWRPRDYFAQVREAVSKISRWEVVENEILLGFFSFSKFLLWRDLDVSNWPNGMGLLEHRVIQKLLGVSSEAEPVQAEPPLVPNDEKIDDYFKPQELVYVLDADSSQTEAIQTTLAGRDLVIQGPPGTGKSQTITNIIAAAVNSGKKVLFIAEKIAALNVVHHRLVQAKLGPVCFQLHSRKASKSSVLQQLRDSIEHSYQPTVPKDCVERLLEAQEALNRHAKRLNANAAPWGLAPFEVLGAISKLTRKGIKPSVLKVPNASLYTKDQIKALTGKCRELVDRLLVSGVPARHPWREAMRGPINPLDSERLKILLVEAADVVRQLIRAGSAVDSQAELGLEYSNHFNRADVEELSAILRIAKLRPEISVDNLKSIHLYEKAQDLKSLAEVIGLYQSECRRISAKLVTGWESYDVSTLRMNFAGSGGSIFSIFSGRYRKALSELRGLAGQDMPKDFAGRLEVLDAAINLMASKSIICETSPKFVEALGKYWGSENSDVTELMVLSTWYLETGNLTEPQFLALTKLLEDSIALSHVETMQSKLDDLQRLESSISDLTSINLECLRANDLQGEEIILQNLIESLSRFNEWPPVRDSLSGLKNEIGEPYIDAIYSGSISPELVIPCVQITLYEQIWQEMVNRIPELATVDAYQLDATLEKFRLLDKERLKIASQEVISSYVSNRPGGYAGDMGLIRQELNKKRNHMPVRKLVSKAGRAIQELKPVFLMSPMSVAQFIQPGSMEFDLVLIDEASQVRPEDAIGAIARAKQVVVVGDDKQLPPTSFFTGISDEEVDLDEDEDGVALSNLESILSLCNIVLPNQCMLRWHYRSHHPGLIAVSNRNFYDNNLLLPPSIIRESYADGMGVSMVKSPQNSYQRGGANGGRNVVEAELIANAVVEFARNHPDKSLGVAAFSVKQRDAIRDLVDNKRRKHPELDEFFSLERDEYFFIKNLESIQGEQRDVIFISVGYGRDSTGRLTQTFGPLGQEGGERRLNVLISRAKDRCTVFSSITADDVRAAPGKLGVSAFREFLQYAEKGYFDTPSVTGKDFDSDFEESVALFLRQNGYQLQPQVGMAGFYIDIGIVDPKNENRFLCGIECDGATYHSSRSARDRDRLRQEILESRGWNIYRIWSTDWFHRRSVQEAKLLDYLSEILAGAQPPKKEVDNKKFSDEVMSPNQPLSDSFVNCVPYAEYSGVYSGKKLPHEIPVREMAKLVKSIVEIEGPVHQDEVARRVSKSFGLERCGRRIQDAALSGLKSAGLNSDGNFWFLAGSSAQIRNRSNVTSKTLLVADNLPPMEIEQALLHLVRQNVRISEEELIQHTSRLFGFNRCGPDLKVAISSVLLRADQLLTKNPDGVYSLRA